MTFVSIGKVVENKTIKIVFVFSAVLTRAVIAGTRHTEGVTVREEEGVTVREEEWGQAAGLGPHPRRGSVTSAAPSTPYPAPSSAANAA